MITIPAGPTDKIISLVQDQLKKNFSNFLHTPDGKPIPFTVYVEFSRDSRRSIEAKISILKQLNSLIQNGAIANSRVHKLGLNMRIRSGSRGRNAALLAIDIANSAGMHEVSIDGVVRKEADEHISLPGLLHYLTPNQLNPILQKAFEKGVKVFPRNTVDTDTVARSIWSALNSARHMGLDLAKYGTFPLTVEESSQVIEQVQRWFTNWTAAPVIFMDQPILNEHKVYEKEYITSGIKEWLKVIGRNRVPVILIDTIDKYKGWKILRTKDRPEGLLTETQIREINKLASSMGVKTLWAGGITLPEVFIFGKMGVFGIYITTAVASNQPLPAYYKKDPLLSSTKEPTIEGVLRAKLLLEAGFLVSHLKDSHIAEDLEKLAIIFIQKLSGRHDEEAIKEAQGLLFSLTVTAWKTYLKANMNN